jgi:hypothetical protein
VPWLRKSRFKALETIRDGARRAFEMRQRFIARRRFQAEIADTGADSGE